MECGSIEKPTKFLRALLENDVAEVQEYLSMNDKSRSNSRLLFRDNKDGKKECIFTPLAVALFYKDEQLLNMIMDSGVDLYAPCEYTSIKSCRCGNPDEDEETCLSMEPAILLTRFLCHFRNVEKWHLLLPMCKRGLDPLRPSKIRIRETEEEGGSITRQLTTTVLDEVYAAMPVALFDDLCMYADISRSFVKKDKIDRFFNMMICPQRTVYEKFCSMVKHGFHDMSEYVTTFDLFIDMIHNNIETGTYSVKTLYHDLFKRFQILLLVCDYTMTSAVDWIAMGAFNAESAVSARLRFFVVAANFMARLKDIIWKWNCTPKPLAVICRSTIRRHVRRPYFVHNVQTLDLPKFLHDFIISPSDRYWTRMGLRALDDDYFNGMTETQF